MSNTSEIKSSLPSRSIVIDEEGFILLSEKRLTDENSGAELLSQITYTENGAFATNWEDNSCFVEAFDEPFVAQQIEFHNKKNTWIITMPYGYQTSFEFSSLSLDQWDRFHGYTADKKIPFVLSRKAQASFFNQLEDFGDDSITYAGHTYSIPAYYESNPSVEKALYWSQIYQQEIPRWDLGQPSPALLDMLPRLKLPKSRVLVLGCGLGHDAAFFAENGHVVTAVDMSTEAIKGARAKYENRYPQITWLETDLFKMGHEHHQAYDLVFEQTCYCAINPTLRDNLIMKWRQFLADQGHLLGVFFAMEKKQGPPFGGTEWELRERLKKHFQFIFWGRWDKSIDRRNGKEFLIYAVKK